jgi:hypothetical protein
LAADLVGIAAVAACARFRRMWTRLTLIVIIVLCGCNDPTLELGRAGWLTEAWLEGEESRPDLKNSEWSCSPNCPVDTAETAWS